MANEIKTDGFYIFDKNRDGSVQKEERPTLYKRVKQFLTSRYAV